MAAPQLLQPNFHVKSSPTEEFEANSPRSISPHTNTEPAKPKYHPLFDSSEADIILSSSDRVWYRIHSFTLRNTSGFFGTLFSLPQPQSSRSCPSSAPFEEDSGVGGSSAEEEKEEEESASPIPTHEASEILTLFLLLLTGKPVPTISSWGSPACRAKLGDPCSSDPALSTSCDVIERVLSLAEMWDAPGPISYIRMGITSPTFLEKDPVRVYAMACHFGWDEARNLAAQHTLTIDLLREEEPTEPEKVIAEPRNPSESDTVDAGSTFASTPSAETAAASSIQRGLERLASKDLLVLLDLRKRRTDNFRMLLNSPVRFSAGNTPDYLCARCGVTQLDNQSWRLLKDALIFEMDRRPLGDQIVGKPVKGLGGADIMNLGAMEWPEAGPCWQARCTKEGCGGLNYDRVATLRQIAYCIDGLPLHIDDFRKC
ncbi:hypothetical protein D9758_006198 [Tetrapyrgos nigripes]|uniref:BTB domain-containing protein n=1 Tax=Tetrapyrgos nigripes TaxID=182062 RepID=A0A8H5LLA9_9AGAR|nr:hypothetical protein D9758_006198 [Tetrapyrgos nigripes]